MLLLAFLCGWLWFGDNQRKWLFLVFVGSVGKVFVAAFLWLSAACRCVPRKLDFFARLPTQHVAFVSQTNDVLIDDFRALRSGLEKEGMFKANRGFFFAWLAHTLVFEVAGAALAWWAGKYFNFNFDFNFNFNLL